MSDASKYLTALLLVVLVAIGGMMVLSGAAAADNVGEQTNQTHHQPADQPVQQAGDLDRQEATAVYENLEMEGDDVGPEQGPAIYIDTINTPNTIRTNEDLTVEYTLRNDGTSEGTESFVDLYVGNTIEDTDESVTVPAGGTTSGTLTFEDHGYSDGETIGFSVQLWDYGDIQNGSVEVQSEPVIVIDSINAPNTITLDEDLEVSYTLANIGDAQGTERFVDLLVDGTDSTFDDTDVDVTIGPGLTAGGTLTLDSANVSTYFNQGDTIEFSVELFDFGDSQSGATDVVPPVVIDSIDYPDTIRTNEDLTVEYTLRNNGGVERTESAVVLGTGGNTVDTDSDVTVPAEGTTSGTLTFEDHGHNNGEVFEFSVQLQEFEDIDAGSVEVQSEPAIVIDSLDYPTTIGPDEDLTVGYTLQNIGDETGTESAVDLRVDGELVAQNTGVQIAPGGTASGTLTFQDHGYSDGESINFLLELADFDDARSRSTDVQSGPAQFAVGIASTNSPVVAGETLSVEAEITNTGESEAEQQVELAVGELGTNSTLVTLAGGASTTETLSVATGAGDAGEYTATVSTEGDSASADVTVTEPGGFTVSIESTTSPVEEGESLLVVALVTNTGPEPETQTVELDVGALGSNSTSLSLDGGESTAETFTLGTEAGDAGEYTATVATANDTASTDVTVVGPGEFTVSIVGTNSPVEPGDTLTVEAEITNTGSSEATQTVTLDVGALGSAEATVSLASGASTTETFSVSTGDGDAGEYTATVASDDDTASTAVTVGGGGGEAAEFDVTIDSTNAPVQEGETLSIEVTITNNGDVEDTQTVTLDAGSLGTVERTVSLAAGESTTETFSLDTATGDAGEYTAPVTSETDEDSTDLAVEAPDGGATFVVTVDNVSTPSDGEGGFRANVTVENTDDFEDTQTITLSSNGTERGSQEVTLGGGESTTLTFSWEQEVEGEGEFTVDVEAASEDDSDATAASVSLPGGDDGDGGLPVPTSTMLVALLLLAVLGAGYYYIRRRQLSQ